MDEYKMTYYVGAMLAQGGVLYVKEDRLTFAPRALERAVGAADTNIPFEKIKMVEVVGTITESLMVRTEGKAHRFVGGDLYKVRDRINAALESFQPRRAGDPQPPQSAAPAPAAPSPAAARPSSEHTGRFRASDAAKPEAQCKVCNQPVRSEFHFCPFCKASLRPSCGSCHRALEQAWKYCAFCGQPA